MSSYLLRSYGGPKIDTLWIKCYPSDNAIQRGRPGFKMLKACFGRPVNNIISLLYQNFKCVLVTYWYGGTPAMGDDKWAFLFMFINHIAFSYDFKY